MPAQLLERGEPFVQDGSLLVKVIELPTQLAQIAQDIGVVLEHVGNRLQRVTRRGVEGGQFDQVVRDFEGYGRSHNGHYVTRGMEAAPCSIPRST